MVKNEKNESVFRNFEKGRRRRKKKYKGDKKEETEEGEKLQFQFFT